jgi:phosphoglycolate phosphatase-like HAD superfamily hydrolase
MTLSTILFDLDGTLVDTAPDLAYALNALLLENGIKFLRVCQYYRYKFVAVFGVFE